MLHWENLAPAPNLPVCQLTEQTGEYCTPHGTPPSIPRNIYQHIPWAEWPSPKQNWIINSEL
jgi:hypothetical protein